MTDLISTQNMTKTYRTGVGRARFREMLPPPVDGAIQRLFPAWWMRNTFDALSDVSLAIPTGSAVGIVGHNGAGKTTLLKVISGVTSPSAGSVNVGGRIAALIDVMVGFHQELTGRENTYLLGAIHGFGRHAMDSRVDQVIEFAEIQEMADTPLKRFSAGMSARLGFATITALDVDALLVDEVLAVGDASFQAKCIRWLDGFRERGGTLLFVSHNLGLIRDMTERLIWLDHGRVIADGPTGEVLTMYAEAMEHRDGEADLRHRRHAHRAVVAQGTRRWGLGGARVKEVHFADLPNKGTGLEVSISYEAAPALRHAVFCVGFVDEGDREIGAAASETVSVLGDRGAVRCEIDPLPLRSGIYFPVVAILSPDGLVQDRWRLDRAVVVDGNGGSLAEFGPVAIPASWSSVDDVS